MAEYQERRRVPRLPIIQPVPAWAKGTMEVRLLDLSLGGARVGHRELLRPGSSCELEFPPVLGSLILVTYVARSAVVGVERTADGDRCLRYESGLAFAEMAEIQTAILTRILERLAD